MIHYAITIITLPETLDVHGREKKGGGGGGEEGGGGENLIPSRNCSKLHLSLSPRKKREKKEEKLSNPKSGLTKLVHPSSHPHHAASLSLSFYVERHGR